MASAVGSSGPAQRYAGHMSRLLRRLTLVLHGLCGGLERSLILRRLLRFLIIFGDEDVDLGLQRLCARVLLIDLRLVGRLDLGRGGLSGLHHRDLALLVDPHKGVRGGGRLQRINGSPQVAVGAVLEADRHGEAGGHLPVGLGFGGTGTDGRPGEELRQVLRADGVERLGRQRQLQLRQPAEQLAGTMQPQLHIEGAVAVVHREVAIVRQTVELGRFELDHLSAQIRQDQAASGPHHHVREFDNANAGKRKRMHQKDLRAVLEIAARLPEGESAIARHIGDYIAGMTDRFALREHERLTGRKLL